MTTLLCQHPAPGGHGIAPRWTRSDKDGVGTAYSASSRVWFTVSKGILHEVYYPTIDRPQIRDLQYLNPTVIHETATEPSGFPAWLAKSAVALALSFPAILTD